MNQKRTKPPRRRLEVTRRHFLTVTGTVILMAGTGCAAGTGRSSGPSLQEMLARAKYPPADGYILVDNHKCQGCASCMLACSLVHEGIESLSLARIQIVQNTFAAYPHDLSIEQCRQCVDPGCVEQCPEQALGVSAEFGNVRLVDRSKCIGCGTCIEACPFTPSRPMLAEDRDLDGELIARKCDLCANTPYHWDEAGGGPNGKQACVSVCPVKAVRFTKEIPLQNGDGGYKINLRNSNWASLGYPTS
ncbi:MAG: 4Fe-4S dicluster domain-containing protein [Proteobacteria bacterium]|nr:4Fe-4S dicluster domain-containing protein [Pseudomonadota bacterium]